MQAQAKYRSDYRSPEFTIDNIHLDFHLDAEATIVTARSQFKRLTAGADLSLDGEQLKLVSVKLNGQTYSDYQEQEGKLLVKGLPDSGELEVVTEVNPRQNKALEGLYLSGDAYCTQCEAEGFRRITYYLDRPDVLAKYTTRISADKAEFPFLLSNGNKIASGEAEGGRHWVEWQDPFPKPSYLFALVAGDFDLLEDAYTTVSGREVALQIFVDKGNLDRAGHAMDSLKASMRWDEQRFGLEYDLDIYMIVAVDFFNMGAMENKGLNVFNSKYVLANKQTGTDQDFLGIEAVIGHEYFHNWTGNRITCRDWFQLSLKEGLTVFRDQEFSSDLGSRAVNRIKNVRILRGHQFAEDAGPMAHPIRPDKVIEMNNFYTLTVYEKGSEVIRMLHTLLGEQGFQAGMKLYVERHDGQAVTCDDFVAAMQDASGKDLSLFKRWYSQSGTPVITTAESFDAAQGTYTLSLKQHTPVTADQSDKQPLHIPVAMELLDETGQLIELTVNGQAHNGMLELTEAQQSWTFEGLSSQPIAVLLKDYSAPVKLEQGLSQAQLLTIVNYSSNTFSRWDAMQRIVFAWMEQAVVAVEQGEALALQQSIVAAFRKLLLDENKDVGLLAELLTIASEGEIADHFEQVNIDAIARARDFLIEQLAVELAQEFAELERYCAEQEQGSLAHSDINWRSLRSVCLFYISFSNGQRIAEVYQQAELMTDKLAALAAANAANITERESLFADYEQNWHHDGLMMDKWFAMQASNKQAGSLQRVKALLEHRSFSLENPNRVRSMVGAFCSANPRHFHAADGSGYQFLHDILLKLNQSNPQVAARLITPLIQSAKLDQARKQLIVKQLRSLESVDDLSKDLFEKVSNALKQLSE